MKVRHGLYILLTLLTAFVSCKVDPYETGDGEYSYLHTDYVDVEVRSRIITKVVTDNNEAIKIPSGVKVDVIPADTTLRWLLYYKQENRGSVATIISKRAVSMLTPMPRIKVKEMKTDAVTLYGAWLSPNGKYINMHLGLKTGTPEEDSARQTIGLVQETSTSEQGNSICYTLYHDQGTVPQYYTHECYFSIPMPETGRVQLKINTYAGEVTKTFEVGTE